MFQKSILPAQIVFASFYLTVSVAPVAVGQSSAQADGLKQAIQIRHSRVAVLRKEIKSKDERIETRLDGLLQLLTSIRDSTNSGSRVARMKEDTAERLMNTIEYYDRKRSAMREELLNPRLNLTNEEKQKILEVFSSRIDKRANQILALHKSMPAHRDLGHNAPRNRGAYDAFEQNRKMATHNNSQRTAMMKELDAAIDRLERQNGTLRSQLSYPGNSSPDRQQLIHDQIARNDELIAKRRKLELEVLKPARTPAQAVSLKEAMDIDKTLQEAIKDLRYDFDGLFYSYNNLIVELSSLHSAEAALTTQSAAKKQ